MWHNEFMNVLKRHLMPGTEYTLEKQKYQVSVSCNLHFVRVDKQNKLNYSFALSANYYGVSSLC